MKKRTIVITAAAILLGLLLILVIVFLLTAKPKADDQANINVNVNNSTVSTQSNANASGLNPEFALNETSGFLNAASENEEIEEDEEEVYTDIPANTTRDYAGWFKVTFPSKAAVDEGDDYFECSSSEHPAYYAFFICDLLHDPEMAEEGADPNIMSEYDSANARELAEANAHNDNTEFVTRQIGKYTWYVVRYNDMNETSYYTDIAQNEYACVVFYDLPLDDPEIESILSTFEVLPGDPCANYEAWYAAHEPEEDKE